MGEKFRIKYNGDIIVNNDVSRRDKEKPINKNKLIKQIMKEENVSWKDAERIAETYK
jgi:hypothetical protein